MVPLDREIIGEEALILKFSFCIFEFRESKRENILQGKSIETSRLCGDMVEKNGTAGCSRNFGKLLMGVGYTLRTASGQS